MRHLRQLSLALALAAGTALLLALSMHGSLHAQEAEAQAAPRLVVFEAFLRAT